jgi:transposase-like protein
MSSGRRRSAPSSTNAPRLVPTSATVAGHGRLTTPAGDIGSSFPSLPEPRRRVDHALWAVTMTAYNITGTSTRKIDDLVRALGCESGALRRVPGMAERSRRDARREMELTLERNGALAETGP